MMKMKVEIEELQDESGWMVRLGDYRVPFRSQAEAQAFAEQLRGRLDAPHDLPLGEAEGD